MDIDISHLKERIEATNYALENEAMLDSVEKIVLRNQLAMLKVLKKIEYELGYRHKKEGAQKP